MGDHVKGNYQLPMKQINTQHRNRPQAACGGRTDSAQRLAVVLPATSVQKIFETTGESFPPQIACLLIISHI